jgi:hypothetical protein
MYVSLPGSSRSTNISLLQTNDPGEVSALDTELARIRRKLEAKYGSDSDSGFTYICTDGTTVPLTPLRMREWCLAIVSHIILPIPPSYCFLV